MLKTRPDISKKSKSCNLDPPSRGTEIRAQQVEAENANTKILQQNKGRLLSSRAHTARTRAGSRGEVHGSITFLAACSSSTPSPTTTYTTFLPNLCIMRSKQLSFPAKTQIKKKNTRGGSRGWGEVTWSEGSEFWKKHVYLAGGMLFVLPIANHNICNVSAKTGDYTLKTALFAWRQTNGL